jgi:hypothetical protein
MCSVLRHIVSFIVLQLQRMEKTMYVPFKMAMTHMGELKDLHPGEDNCQYYLGHTSTVNMHNSRQSSTSISSTILCDAQTAACRLQVVSAMDAILVLVR